MLLLYYSYVHIWPIVYGAMASELLHGGQQTVVDPTHGGLFIEHILIPYCHFIFNFFYFCGSLMHAGGPALMVCG